VRCVTNKIFFKVLVSNRLDAMIFFLFKYFNFEPENYWDWKEHMRLNVRFKEKNVKRLF